MKTTPFYGLVPNSLTLCLLPATSERTICHLTCQVCKCTATSNHAEKVPGSALREFAFRTPRAGKHDPGCPRPGVSGTCFGNRLLRFCFRGTRPQNREPRTQSWTEASPETTGLGSPARARFPESRIVNHKLGSREPPPLYSKLLVQPHL